MAMNVGNEGPSSEINVTPMIDVLLVLLIIFMVTQPMSRRAFDVQVPPEQQQRQAQQQQSSQIVLELRADGVYAINNQPYTRDQLDAALHEIYDARPAKLLFIKAAASRKYADVVDAMDIARGAGVQVIGFTPDERAGSWGRHFGVIFVVPPSPPSPVPRSDADPVGPPRRGGARPTVPAARLRLPRRRSGVGAVLSFVVHAAIIVMLVQRGRAALDNGGGGAGPRGGGAGGVEFFTLPAPPAMTAVPLPPAPAIVAPTIVLPEDALADLVPVAPPSMPPTEPAPGSGSAGGGGAGGGAGGGVGTEIGPGTGGDERYIFPPNPRGVIVPPENPPKAVRGRAYRVQFWVSADGRVERIVVTPEISDEKYRRDFHERMRNYRFYPAKTRDGRPVPHVVAITNTP